MVMNIISIKYEKEPKNTLENFYWDKTNKKKRIICKFTSTQNVLPTQSTSIINKFE